MSALGLPPAQSGLRSSSSGRASPDEEGHAADRIDKLVDEVEEGVVCPVQVLEDEHERALVRERLQELSPGSERLAAAIADRGLLAPEADEQAQERRDPVGLGRIVDDTTNRRSQLRSTFAAGSLSRIPASALTISPSAQKLTPSP